MTLWRYKQIRSAFHPEDRSAGAAGDKAYQLRHAINNLNTAAANTKHIAENVAFDEGGSASRHRMNPIRQYNKDKPKKFRVDFFILACSLTYFIHHLDVYQGANATNVGIHRAVRSLPTTQKAVLNAVLSTDMHNEVHGARHIAMDNRYQSPQLAFVLRQKFKILSTGTCRKNRKGWDREQMSLDKKEGRGSYKFIVDHNNKVLCCQWVDSKVVNVVSSILSDEVEEVKRQVGSEKKQYPCPKVLVRYQKTMQGVDNGDQMRAAGGGFALKAHYKKWYKRAYFAILDMMTLNALIAWNLSCKAVPNRKTLKRHEFLWYISQRMLDFEDSEREATGSQQEVHSFDNSPMGDHVPTPCVEPDRRCAVCRLDYNTEKLARKGSDAESVRLSAKNITNGLAICSKCRITAHPMLPKDPRKIHSMEEFANLTCFQIAHTPVGMAVWQRCDPNASKGARSRAYNPQMKHPVCERLRSLYGMKSDKARKRKAKVLDNEEDDLADGDEDSTTIT
jgi:Transposase IS4